MKANVLILVLVWAAFLGLAAWRLGGTEAIESLTATVRCGVGQCPLRVAAGAAQPDRAPAAAAWPPRLGAPYPDLVPVDQTGEPVRLSSFKGSVLLIEPVGMNCPACQAFAGAHRLGPYEGVAPQEGLPSIEELLPKFTGGLSLADDRIVFVQLLLYSMTMGAPTPDDAREWARHFRVDRARQHLVLAGTKELLGQASYDMIPGFQPVDRDFVLRVDATGLQPRHDLSPSCSPRSPDCSGLRRSRRRTRRCPVAGPCSTRGPPGCPRRSGSTCGGSSTWSIWESWSGSARWPGSDRRKGGSPRPRATSASRAS